MKQGARNIGRFGSLLAALVLLIGFSPFADAGRAGLPRYSAFVTLVIVTAVYAVSQRRAVLYVGLALGLPAVALRWISYVEPTPLWVVLNSVAAVALLGFVMTVLLTVILREDNVTVDTIFGGICVYLLLGVGWAEAYQLLESVHPGSFDLGWAETAQPVREGLLFSYFSFATLTTLGYGDIVPTTAEAQALVILESVAGRLFLAIFIARLVGLHMATGYRRGG
jgi:hypothetical protein